MMMANHNDPIALKALFEENVVGKLPHTSLQCSAHPSPLAGG
jgi:hypothetical protein